MNGANGASGGLRLIGNMKNEFTGYSIVMTGSCAADRIPAMLEKHRDRFSKEFIDRFAPRGMKYSEGIPCGSDETGVSGITGNPACDGCDSGGISAALWSLGERLGCGMRVELGKITVSQLAVELCELEDVSPYEIGGGIELLVTKDPKGTLAGLRAQGLEAAVIGQITDGNDRVIVFGEITRFITPR